jgi:hypothetical protein
MKTGTSAKKNHSEHEIRRMPLKRARCLPCHNYTRDDWTSLLIEYNLACQRNLDDDMHSPNLPVILRYLPQNARVVFFANRRPVVMHVESRNGRFWLRNGEVTTAIAIQFHLTYPKFNLRNGICIETGNPIFPLTRLVMPSAIK